MADSRRRRRSRDRRRAGTEAASRRAGTERRSGRRAGTKPRRSRRAAPRRRAPGSVLLRLLAMLLMVAALLACAVIFFKVTDIQVTGCQLYTVEQVAGACGISLGDNLLLIRKPAAAARLKILLPYIENVRIGRALPGTVTIEVSESGAAFSVEAEDGTSWLINGSGKVLEEAGVSAADYPKLTGVILKEPEPGLQALTGQTSNLAVAQQLMELLGESDIVPQITEIDVSKTFDIVVWYGNQYEVHLGGTDRLDYKLRYLFSILDQLDSARGGVIDLTLEEKDVAVFREFENGEEDS